MKILCVGGGPGGLYAALLLKRAFPLDDIVVKDRNPPDATYGWGVVFSDETLGFLEDADPPSYAAITDQFIHWTDIDIFYRDQRVSSGGHAFSGLARVALLQILQRRCQDTGVRLEFGVEVDAGSFAEYDLVIAADGVNSAIRRAGADHFKPVFDVHPTKYIWLGAEIDLDAFTFIFRHTEFGLFQVHAYPFAPHLATFIVECNEPVWRAAGLHEASDTESVEFCTALFADHLAGARLLSNRSTWINFQTLRTETWRTGHVVLLGDAAHTAHFSIGSGTKLAMEDAIGLATALQRHPEDVQSALVEYEELRRPSVERIQAAARESSLWFEQARRYAHFAPTQFAFSLLTRSKRVTYENLARRDPAFTGQVDRWFAGSSRANERASHTGEQVSTPLETAFAIREIHLPNRVAAVWRTGDSGTEGSVHGIASAMIATKARSDAALLLTDMVAVSAAGRISERTPGLYDDAHVSSWQEQTRVADEVGNPVLGVLLGHAGARGACRPSEDGIDRPATPGWPLLAASPVRYSPAAQVPRAMDEADMDDVISAFVQATKRAHRCGFRVLEIDMAHGYLLGGFLSPLTNLRSDAYGGDVRRRLHFPQRVFEAVRATWPAELPLAVRINAADWAPGGIQPDDVVTIVRTLRDAGCDLFDVVSGWTTANANPPYGRTWQVPLSDAVRNECHVPTVTGGLFTNRDEVNTALAAGRADLCVVSASALPPL